MIMEDRNKRVYEILNSLDKDDSEKQSENAKNNNNHTRVVKAVTPQRQHRESQTTQRRKSAQNNSSADKSATTQINRPKKKTKKKKKSNHLIRLFLLLILIFAISITLSFSIISLGKDVLGINSNDSETIVVTIPEGSTVKDVANILKEKNIIENPQLFVLFSKLSKSDSGFIAGDHEVRANMAYETLINSLVSDAISDENAVTLTFVEGITLYEAAQMLETGEVCNADDFIEAFNKSPEYGLNYESYMPTFVSNMRFYKMEGYLFPDTYTFYKDMSPDLVCQKILKNFDEKITDEMYEKMDELDINLDKTLIFASIVQKEAGSVEEMSKVASVFWNRLNNSDVYPKLQSDTTTTYIENTIKPHIDSINQEMFDAYDTYTCTGFPAGAVCNPGIDAINAVLNPDKTDYFYFYSDEKTGESYFATNYEEHLANIEMVNEKYGITSENTDDEDDTDTSEDSDE
jgi:UPF0755 protein